MGVGVSHARGTPVTLCSGAWNPDTRNTKTRNPRTREPENRNYQPRNPGVARPPPPSLTTWWCTNFSSKFILHTPINFRAVCGVNMVNRWSRTPQNDGGTKPAYSTVWRGRPEPENQNPKPETRNPTTRKPKSWSLTPDTRNKGPETLMVAKPCTLNVIPFTWRGGQICNREVPRQVLGPYGRAYQPTHHLRDSLLPNP